MDLHSRLQATKIDEETATLDKDVDKLKAAVDFAQIQLLNEKDKLLNITKSMVQPKKESIFSTKYDVPMLAERKTIGTARGSHIAQPAPVKNGSVQQTKPYCCLI